MLTLTGAFLKQSNFLEHIFFFFILIRQNHLNSLLTISVLNSGLCVQDLRLPVVGSQIVGLIPLKALLDAADFYIKRDGLFVVQEEHKIRLVRQPLTLGFREILERTLAGWRSG